MTRLALTALLLLVAAAPAGAAALNSARAVTLGPGAGDPVAWAGAKGDAAVAWSETAFVPGRVPQGGRGVWAALRARGGDWRVREIGEERATGVAMHANAGRVTAVAWETVSRVAPLTLAVAVPGRGWFAPAAVPLPAGHADAGGASIAVAPDGSVAIAYRAGERGDAPGTAVLVLRRPDGSFSQPQVLAQGVSSGPFVKVDRGGGLHALWSASEGRIRRIFAAHGRVSAGLGPARAISDDVLDADNRAAPPVLAANDRGDLLAVWSPVVPPNTMPSDVVASYRPAGGEWDAPKLVSQPGFLAFRPTAAVGARGEAVATWALGQGLGAATRRDDGTWSPPQSSAVLQGTLMAMPVAVLRGGSAVSVRRVDNFNEPERMAAVVRRPGGCFGAERDLARAGTPVSAPAIASKRSGGALVAWGELTGDDGRMRVRELGVDARRAPRSCPARPTTHAPAMRIVRRTKAISRRALRSTGVRATVVIRERVAMHYELLDGDRVVASQLEAAGEPLRQRVVLRPEGPVKARRLTLRITRAVQLTDRVTRSYRVTVR